MKIINLSKVSKKIKEYKKEAENLNNIDEDTLEKVNRIINTNIQSIQNNVNKIIVNKEKGLEKYIKTFEVLIEDTLKLVEELCEKIDKNKLNNYIIDEYVSNFNRIINLMRIILKLELFSKDFKDVILIGANGAGKSFFAKFLKENLSNTVVSPAQKYLYIVEDAEKTENFDSLNSKKESIEIKKISNTFSSYSDLNLKLFSNIIIAVLNEHTAQLQREHDKQFKGEMVENRGETIFQAKVIKIFRKLFKNIQLKKCDYNIDVEIEKENSGEKYHINSMSDGERAILYYISLVMSAPKNSYIIIDEPETHLNSMLIKELWDLIKQERKDCKFIFISHNLEFINTMKNSDIIWCKSFTYPSEWEFEKIEKTKIPMELITQLVCSKKPLLFCEGSKKSLDYEVYSYFFGEDFIVFPVGGNKDVVSITESYNKTFDITLFKSFGIIDGDLLFKSEKNLNRNNIIVLPFNEIEMLLFEENIMKKVLIRKKIKVEKIKEFKDAFFNKLAEKKEEILVEKMKKEIDCYLEKEKITNTTNMKELKKNYNQIIKFNIEKKEKESIKNLEKIIKEKNYIEALKWCSLKNEIFNLATKIFLIDYKKEALKEIKENSELRLELKIKIFQNKIKMEEK